MPDDAKKTAKPATAKDRNADTDSMFVMNRRAFETWAQGMSRLSQEMAQFMETRLREEAAMWEKLAACRNPADLLACQSEFAAKTGTHYADAAQKLSRLVLDFASSYGSSLLHSPTDTD